jgi:hypothetical protein
MLALEVLRRALPGLTLEVLRVPCARQPRPGRGRATVVHEGVRG